MKLRIAIVSQCYAQYACRLAAALSREHAVLLILDQENASKELSAKLQADLAASSVEVLKLPKARSLGKVWCNYKEVGAALRSFSPDILHCQEGGVWDEILPFILLRLHKSFVLTIHDPVPHVGIDQTRNRVSRHRLYKYLMRKLCAAVIVHGVALREMLVDIDMPLSRRAYVVPHGVLCAEERSHNKNWEDGTLLFFGRINQYKGLGDFISAVKLLWERGVRVRATIAGTGPDLDKYRHDIESSEMFDLRERFISTTETAEIFNRANVVVLPYLEGTQSGVAAMALGYGRAIIATKVGSIGEMVHENFNGILVAPGEPRELADAIETMISNPSLTARFADGSWSLGRSIMSWESIGVQTTKVYETALSLRHKTLNLN